MVAQSILAVFAIALIAVSVSADGDSCPRTQNAPSICCGRVRNSTMSDAEIDNLVIAINTFRRDQNSDVRKIKWNNKLAKSAQKWANKCSQSKIPNGCNGPNTYQLVYRGPHAEFPYEVVRENIWTNEKIFTPPPNTEYWVLDKVGCGRIISTEGKYLVCNFTW